MESALLLIIERQFRWRFNDNVYYFLLLIIKYDVICLDMLFLALKVLVNNYFSCFKVAHYDLFTSLPELKLKVEIWIIKASYHIKYNVIYTHEQ